MQASCAQFRRSLAARPRGFSLVETMVVLVVAAVILGMAIPDFLDHQRRNRTEAAAEDLAARIRLGRQKAITRRATYRLVLDPQAGTYRLERRDPGGQWVEDPPGTFSLPPQVNLQTELGGDPGNLDLELDPQGTVDAADVPGWIRLLSASDTLSVSVVRTGRVRVQRGD